MIDIHYQDQDLLVVEKPSGLLTVPGKGIDKQDCLINRLKIHYPTALVVHRLDMATSGLLVVALTKKTHRLMSELFAKRQVEKNYIAIVNGIVDKAEGEIDLPLICDWPNRPKQKVDYMEGKASLTQYHVLSVDKKNNCSRVSLKPITGRSHQLRVHMLSIGHAIWGDNLYATDDVIAKSPRLLLHAQQLGFTHPVNQNKISFLSDPAF